MVMDIYHYSKQLLIGFMKISINDINKSKWDDFYDCPNKLIFPDLTHKQSLFYFLEVF